MEDRALTGLAGRYGFPVAVFLLFAWRFLHFGPEIDAPHDWRQCDTAWYIRDFYKNGVDLLHPAVCWMGARDTLALEFPLPEAVVAWFYRAFGESIPLARLIFLGFFAGAAAYFFRIAHFILGRPLARLATLVYLAAPPEMRSRVLGVLTVCIGLGPIGFLHLGILAELFGARTACIITGSEGLLALALTWRVWRPVIQEETTR